MDVRLFDWFRLKQNVRNNLSYKCYYIDLSDDPKATIRCIVICNSDSSRSSKSTEYVYLKFVPSWTIVLFIYLKYQLCLTLSWRNFFVHCLIIKDICITSLYTYSHNIYMCSSQFYYIKEVSIMRQGNRKHRLLYNLNNLITTQP